MILQSLVEYYEALVEKGKVAKPGWCDAKVSYGVELSIDGKIQNILCFKEASANGKKMIPTIMKVPEMATRSSGVSANFLCDNAKYFLGIEKEGVNSRSIECFQAAKEKHLQILKDVKGSAAEAICRYFEDWNPENAEASSVVKEHWEELTDTGNLVFYVDFSFAQENEEIKKAWENYRKENRQGTKSICLVTGKKEEISRIHKVIKGVPGTQASGAALVSFNAPSFESYGKEQSFNAPVSQYAEFAYTTALNYLLAKREYTFMLGDSMVTYWAEEAKTEYQEAFFLGIEAPAEKDNQEVLEGIFKNLRENKPVGLDGTTLNMEQKFYILCLAPNAARLSVRFFYPNSFGDILNNLAEHYQRMEMVKPAWEQRKYIGIRGMIFETVNQKSKDKKPASNMAALVLQAILSGNTYPASLYTDVLIRIRAEQGKITWGRASIIKAYLIKNHKWQEGEKFMALQDDSRDTAYVLGRLFSVLESIQMDANPKIKATIRDRYFNSACAAPASVFPILVKLKNSHIKKIEREKASSKKYYENLLTEIMEKLEGFPARLNLEEQGKFILGYYHQMQKRYEKKEEK